jgi:hypothetical protein
VKYNEGDNILRCCMYLLFRERKKDIFAAPEIPVY